MSGCALGQQQFLVLAVALFILLSAPLTLANTALDANWTPLGPIIYLLYLISFLLSRARSNFLFFFALLLSQFTALLLNFFI